MTVVGLIMMEEAVAEGVAATTLEDEAVTTTGAVAEEATMTMVATTGVIMGTMTEVEAIIGTTKDPCCCFFPQSHKGGYFVVLSCYLPMFLCLEHVTLYFQRPL